MLFGAAARLDFSPPSLALQESRITLGNSEQRTLRLDRRLRFGKPRGPRKAERSRSTASGWPTIGGKTRSGGPEANDDAMRRWHSRGKHDNRLTAMVSGFTPATSRARQEGPRWLFSPADAPLRRRLRPLRRRDPWTGSASASKGRFERRRTSSDRPPDGSGDHGDERPFDANTTIRTPLLTGRRARSGHPPKCRGDGERVLRLVRGTRACSLRPRPQVPREARRSAPHCETKVQLMKPSIRPAPFASTSRRGREGRKLVVHLRCSRGWG